MELCGVGDNAVILQSARHGRPEILQQPQSLPPLPGAFVSFGVSAIGVARCNTNGQERHECARPPIRFCQ